MKSYLSTVVFLSLSLTLLSSCGGVNIFSVSQDAKLGQEIDTEITNNPQEYPPYQNETVRAYVQNIVDRIVQSPNIKYRGTFPYKVMLINDDKTVNAFATPGGYVYVYTGLLRFVENEATLAGVLAHEIAHAEERHGTEHMTQAMGTSALLAIVTGSNRSAIVNLAANSATLLATLANSRSDELEADTKGFGYLQSTPYWPGGIKLFFDKMLIEQGRGTSIFEKWLSTHPAPEDRVKNINELMVASQTPPPTSDNLMTTNYRTMLRSLR